MQRGRARWSRRSLPHFGGWCHLSLALEIQSLTVGDSLFSFSHLLLETHQYSRSAPETRQRDPQWPGSGCYSESIPCMILHLLPLSGHSASFLFVFFWGGDSQWSRREAESGWSQLAYLLAVSHRMTFNHKKTPGSHSFFDIPGEYRHSSCHTTIWLLWCGAVRHCHPSAKGRKRKVNTAGILVSYLKARNKRTEK